MSEEQPLTLERLTDLLFEAVVGDGMDAVRDAYSVRLLDDSLALAVVASRPDPNAVDGRIRNFGAQLGIRCPALFGEDVFEFTYGVGQTDEDAAIMALRQWVDLDLPVLIEAATGDLERCQKVTLNFGGPDEALERQWDIFVGPMRYVAGEAAQPCCQMCLFTMSMPALAPLLDSRTSCAIKVVALKDGMGATTADCRRNGFDLPDAIEAIAAAARDWPAIGGAQMRRQYFYFRAPS